MRWSGWLSCLCAMCNTARRTKASPIAWSIVVIGGLAACQPADLPTPVAPAGPTRAQPLRVAVLLPYGSDRPGDTIIARALEDAARLAAADASHIDIEISIHDTAGRPETAAAAARKAAGAGARAIIGPLYGDVTQAVGSALDGAGIPILSFSNNAAVAGGDVYVLGNTFENTARRILDHAARQGRERIVMLYGADPSGQAARNAVRRAARPTAATIIGEIAYEPSQNGVIAAAPIVRDTVETSQADAILLTSGTSGALPLFAQLLPEAGVNPEKVRFMGLARWDVPAEALALPGLQGGWFVLPDPALSVLFDSHFAQTYGRIPHPLAGLGYDAVAAIAAIVQEGAARIDPAELTDPAGFVGVQGVFRLRTDGTNERALAVARISQTKVQVISAAPRRFENF